MTERSWWWGGTATGDAAMATYGAPYTDGSFTQALSFALLTNPSTMGVVYRTDSPYSGNLAVTLPGAATARVAPGVAIVNGRVYENTANIDINVAGADATYYIILQSDIANQTVRATYGVSASMVQNANYWEILLATVVKSGGILTTVTDNRVYVNNTNTSGAGGGGTAGTTYTTIDQVVVPAGGATVTFSAIPQTYGNIEIVAYWKCTAFGGGMVMSAARMTLNAIGTNNYNYYDWTRSSTFSDDTYSLQASQPYFLVGAVPPGDSTGWGYARISVPAYAQSGFMKIIHSDYSGMNTGGPNRQVGLFHGELTTLSNPVTSIELQNHYNTGSGNYYFAEGSIIALYGF